MGKRGPERDKELEIKVAHLRQNKYKTFEEIGKKLGFSKQRAHSIYRRWQSEMFSLIGENNG